MKKDEPAKDPAQDGLAIEYWPIDRPKPYEKNARRLSDRAVDALAASISSFGFRQPIVVDKEDIIVVGHTRLMAAAKLGLSVVPVHIATGLTPAQCKAYRLADNRTADEASWDEDLLAQELREIQATGAVDPTSTGFEAIEIEVLLRPPPPADEDTAPAPPKRPVSKPGDVWELGAHRVMCGDATRREDAEKLLATRRPDLAIAALGAEDTDLLADVVFTDPPYNVDYEGYTKERLKIKSDCMPRAQFLAFLTATFQTYKSALKATASMYVCHASVYQREFQDAIEAAGFSVRCQIIWAKNTFGWGFGRYKFQHEPIFYCHGGTRPDTWYGDKTQSTLWTANKPAASRLHPTMKPVELIERALENSSKPGDIVLDLFGGSGSTLIACEKQTRRARLMELDPQYVDVIVARWEQYTGQRATSAEDGRTFEDVGAERLNATEKAKTEKQRRAVNRKPAFLKAFVLTASLTEAAKATGQHRGQHYDWLREDKKYKAAFEEASVEAGELLEDEAIRRAMVGVLKPVYYQGKAVGAERIYSDGLMQFLLRGFLPAKYRPATALEVTGKDGGPIEMGIVERLNAARNQLAAAKAK